MLKVGIVGASGYTGVELSRILSGHPDVELTITTSRQYAGKSMAEIYPSLRGIVENICVDPGEVDIASQADVFFTAVPHQTAMSIVPALIEEGKKVIDLSADFRIKDHLTYEQWYQAHTAKEYLSEAVYGLPEIHRAEIIKARLVANPGCYPTSIILGMNPLLKNKIIEPSTIIADSKSGTSGAGRTAQVGALYCEVADGFKAYKVGAHRHTPEIEQELNLLAGEQFCISFTPHLVPMSRGILSTVYAKMAQNISEESLIELYASFYKEEPFVRICNVDEFPATQHVRGSNFCDIGLKVDSRTGRVVVVSAIDNLVKGAAGQAVQNMNLICGFEETQGLLGAPFFP